MSAAASRSVEERLAVLETKMDDVVSGQQVIRRDVRRIFIGLVVIASALKALPDISPLLKALAP